MFWSFLFFKFFFKRLMRKVLFGERGVRGLGRLELFSGVTVNVWEVWMTIGS